MAETAELRRIALEAAELAASILTEKFDEIRQIDFKGRVNLVTDADRRSEEAVVAFLSRECPDHGIVGEEGTATHPDSPYQWYVDPLDGTTNYAHGQPIFASSVGVALGGQVVAGAVVAPGLRETYAAGRGQGATLNGAPIRVSPIGELVRGLLATGFPYDPTPETSNLDHFGDFVGHAQAVRRLGSAAIDLCWVAAGRFDGYWERGVHAWDMAAGSLMVEEAGGRLSGLAGGPYDVNGRQIVASNGLIHDAIVAILGERISRRRGSA